MIVNCVAFVAVIVRIDVYPVATVVGDAVIVTDGTFKIPLPEKRAQPDITQLSAIDPEPRRNRKILLVVRSVANVCSPCKNVTKFKSALRHRAHPLRAKVEKGRK